MLCAQLNAAVGQLGHRPVTDASVHEARKQLKKARATLRLLRPALGSAYDRDNAAIRDAARPLSAVRDGRALLDTLDKLAGRYGPPARAIKSGAFRRVLERERRAARRRMSGARSAMEPQRADLKALASRAARRKMNSCNWQVVGAGLKRVYANGRKAFRQARDACSPEALHEWRKQAKYLRYQVEILTPLWHGPIGKRADQLHKLADELGEDHDLVVLRGKVAAHRETFADVEAQDALLGLIDRRRARLQRKAIARGGKLYEEKPTDFERRFREYWRIWRHKDKARRAG